MKLKFRLNSAQAAIAYALAKSSVECAQANAWGNDVVTMCGDFACIDTGYGVRQQNLFITDNSLTYEGGRTTLQSGSLAALDAIIRIFGSQKAATEAMVSCESSAPYLKWFETEEDGLPRATVERLCQIAGGKYTSAASSAVNELVKRLKALGWKPSMTERQMAANFSSKELKDIRQMVAAAAAAGCTSVVAQAVTKAS